MELAKLNVLIGADLSELQAKLEESTKSLRATGAKMQSIGKTMSVAITAPIVATGLAAIKMGVDFNQGMADVGALLPGNTARVKELKGAVQDMAMELGTTTGDLSKGLYQVVSAFGDSADAVKILDINTRSAKAGLASVTEAIDLTSAVTKSYGDTSAEAVLHASDLAQLTVRLGQTTFPELAGAIGAVTPLAAGLNVTQEELFGTMATFTGVTGGASAVSTQLRGVLQALMAPTDATTKLFAQLGVESGAALVKQEGLQGAIEALVRTAEKTGEPLQSFIGSIEGQTLALSATGGQAGTYTAKMLQMKDAAGATDGAFRAQTEGINASGFAMDQARQTMSVSMQKIGDIILPTVAKITTAVASVAAWFGALPAPMQEAIIVVAGLAAAVGPLLVVLGTVLSVLPALGVALAVLTGPVGLVMAAVVAMAAAWYQWGDDVMAAVSATVSAVTGWFNQTFAPALQAIGALATAVGDMFTAFGRLVGAVIEAMVTGAVSWLRDTFGPALAWLGNALAPVGQAFVTLKDLTVGVVTALVNGVTTLFNGLVSGAFAKLTQGIQWITDKFNAMYMAVVGGSIVPDMVDGVVAEFTKMHGATVQSTEALRAEVVQKFGALSTATQTSTREMVEGVAASLNHLDQVTQAVNTNVAASHTALTGVLTEEGKQRAAALEAQAQAAEDEQETFLALGGTLEKVSVESVKHVETMRGGLLGAFDSIKGSIGGLVGGLDGFLGKLGGVGQAIQGLLGGAGGGGIGGALMGTISSLIPGGSIVNAVVGPLVQNVAGKVAGAVGGVAKKIGHFFGFADGGFHTGGLRLVGEEGPELEVTGPARYYSHTQTQDLLSGSHDDGATQAQIRVLQAGFSAVVDRLNVVATGQEDVRREIRRSLAGSPV